jgi:ribosomal protein S6
MQDTIHDDAMKVYEIGYLLVSSVPKEKLETVVSNLKSILSNKGAEIIAEENPELISLSYTMTKKIGTVNHRFDEAYFGWVKFELSAKNIEEVKKAFDLNPEMLRFLLIITVRDDTFLGKKAPVANVTTTVEVGTEAVVDTIATESLPLETKPAGATLEEMDKSIDEMVKGA